MMRTFAPTLEPSETAPREASPFDKISPIEAGYPFEAFEQLSETLSVTQQQLAGVLGISRSTLSRRRGGRLNPLESNRLYQIRELLGAAELSGEALRAIGDPDDARRWLRTPNAQLGWVPLELAATTPGLDAVKRYFEQIADGVYL
jgi:putative toxin-antitoxin system antitoxin component (TIGR02293 family)